MKAKYIFVLSAVVLSSCSKMPEIAGQSDYAPTIYPDYKEVCIPYNIAPLNFAVTDTTADWLKIEAGNEKIVVKSDGKNGFDINEDDWHKLLLRHRGERMTYKICQETDEGLIAYAPFDILISEDMIDSYLAYRLIPPGYAMWNRMSIAQRNLETFDEEQIYENRYGQGNCVNCHSFCQQSPDKMLFHLRKRHGGTFIFTDGKPHKVGADLSEHLSNPVYPYWHPSGKYVAFSTNKTFQMFHSSDENRIEVGDDASDVVVYDVEKDRMITTKAISSENAFETFPCFSADGQSLYFASAVAVDTVERNYEKVKYSICRIAFNTENQTFGEKVDTLYNARTEGRSAVFPRISPDGRLLVFTVSDYGNFTIWHRDAELYVTDLKTDDTRALTEINSEDVESYHSFCSNGRWMVFSSRRDDGLYTRPYFTHIDSLGQFSKPFMLPQKDPRNYYLMQNNSYNIPEFIKREVDLDTHDSYESLRKVW